MPVDPVEVAALALIDSPSINTPVSQPTLVVTGGTLGLIAAGGSTPSPIGGGGGTVQTAAPVSGDGSSGSKVTIAAGAIALSKLATQADQTVAGNVSGGAASPVALTKTQLTTLVNPASASLSGALTSANYSALAVVNTDFLVQEAVAASASGGNLLPALTSWKRIPIGAIPVGTTTAPNTNDGAVEGMGIKANNAAAVTYLGQSAFQLPKTGKWWIAFKAALAGGGAAGHDSEVGLCNAAGTHVIMVIRRNATSSTKYSVGYIGSSTLFQAGTVAADNNQHQFRMFFDGTSILCYVDGVLDNTLASAFTTDEPMYPATFSATVAEAVIEDCVIGFIG